MSRAKTVVLGLLTVWPIVYCVAVLGIMFSVDPFATPGKAEDPQAFEWLIYIIPVHVLTILIGLGLQVYFIIHLSQTAEIDSNKKLLWALVIFFLNIIGMPVYWYLHFWKQDSTHLASQPDRP